MRFKGSICNKGTWGQYGGFQSNTIPISMLSNALLENYGYVESYVKKGSKLEKINEKWSKAGSNSKRR